MQHIFSNTDSRAKARPSMSISSGPGAPMFEAGPHTRIRRAPLQAIAAVSVADGPREIFGRVLNISPGGCLLQTETTLESGTFVELNITVLGQEDPIRVEVAGVIRRQVTGQSRRQYGVEFLAVDSNDKKSLQWLYAQASS
ncbi:PilZ domain-containing protein [Bradymonas sediminis]|nr:PilZ domain-containing protein [Bradymonas sediminis]TDP71831.1 PilZ domain-containing protein [Bradymonas sediminis]